ncbi:MAG: flavin reductase [Gammaproteobacteria bacterium]|nr:flavin reductase [Gammaproteobacteria bacterium]
MSSNELDKNGYRRALGCFATGVAIATTVDKCGKKSGMTISSFNSVSLDPPLVLWSIDRESNNFEAFIEAEHFAVHVLTADQKSICERFAGRGTDKFEGLDCTEGVARSPILPDYSAVFECETEHRYDGGDHVILVGRVLKFDDRETDPLIFYRGHYLK